jgi:hypothetical protein
LIETAYREAEKDGIAVWCQDEAGPYQAISQPGERWAQSGEAVRYPHTYVRAGTAKMLTLFHPATGWVRVKGVTRSTNGVLHPWIKEQISQIVATLPEAVTLPEEQNRLRWERWREGLSVKFSLLSSDLPPLRMLLIWDNLAGHWSADMLVWLMRQGVMALFTPIAASWLNLAESVQRILVRRAVSGRSFESAEAVMASLEAVATGWNADPTPFEWGGRRKARRDRAKERHRLGGSGGFTRRPVRRRWNNCYACSRDK